MKDESLKLEEMEASLTLGGVRRCYAAVISSSLLRCCHLLKSLTILEKLEEMLRCCHRWRERELPSPQVSPQVCHLLKSATLLSSPQVSHNT
jgi:hypothetical protein